MSTVRAVSRSTGKMSTVRAVSRRTGKMSTVPAVSRSTGNNELPVDGAVRVTKVDRIQAYNLVSRPSVYHAVSVTAASGGPAESMAVSVVRVGDVVDSEHDGFVSVSVA